IAKFTAKGSTMSFALNGFAQSQIGVVITLGSTRFCTTFGGTITKDDGLKFSAKLAPAPGACPSIAPTTTTTSTVPTTTPTTIPTTTSTSLVPTTTTSSSTS